MAKAESNIETKPDSQDMNDPVLSMLGVGKHLWKHETGDKFVERLRSEDLMPPPFNHGQGSPAESAAESVWRRIENHQGEEFKTATRLPFTYAVEGAGIWFFRNGRRINRKLTRNQVEKAMRVVP